MALLHVWKTAQDQWPIFVAPPCKLCSLKNQSEHGVWGVFCTLEARYTPQVKLLLHLYHMVMLLYSESRFFVRVYQHYHARQCPRIRTLGACIRISLVCEGNLRSHGLWQDRVRGSFFASIRCTAECCVLPYRLTMWLWFSSISYCVRMHGHWPAWLWMQIPICYL